MPDAIASDSSAANPASSPATTTTNGAAASAAVAPWFSTIEDAGIRGYAENKAWKSPAEAITSYRELESSFTKIRGVPAERLLTLPGTDAKPEEWAPVYDRLGRPKTAEEYKLAGPDGALTDPFAAHIAPVMHTLGITAAQAKGLNEAYNGFAKQLQEQQAQEFQLKADADFETLKQEWPGQVYGERMELAKRAARAYGLDEDTLNKIETALGTAGVYRLFAKIGAGQSEAKFEEGNGSSASFGMTPDGARARIAALKTDKEFTRRVNANEAAALQQLDQLQRIAVADRSNERR